MERRQVIAALLKESGDEVAGDAIAAYERCGALGRALASGAATAEAQ